MNMVQQRKWVGGGCRRPGHADLQAITGGASCAFSHTIQERHRPLLPPALTLPTHVPAAASAWRCSTAWCACPTGSACSRCCPRASARCCRPSQRCGDAVQGSVVIVSCRRLLVRDAAGSLLALTLSPAVAALVDPAAAALLRTTPRFPCLPTPSAGGGAARPQRWHGCRGGP